jgi:glycosyltransferase involved in cell wall biosynthesis
VAGRRGAQKLRLCFVADAASVHTLRWIRFFAERGHEIAVASARAPESGVHIKAYCRLSNAAPVPWTRILRNVLELRRFLRSFDPHLLHAHYINESGWLAALSGFHPFVLTAWGSDVYVAPRRSLLARILSPWAVRRADYVTADSQDQVEILRQMGAPARATAMVGWGADVRSFSGRSGRAWRAAHGIQDEQAVILSPRRWVENSNILVILDAFAFVRRRCPNAVLILKDVPGSSVSLREQILSQVRLLGISDTTLIVGEIPEDELPELYAASDITVSVCSSDGTPVSVLEAMAGRSAVIAGDLPSLREWVRDGETGVLVPVGNHETLGKQLVRLVESAALRQRLTEAAHEMVRTRADRFRTLEGMELVYYRLATNRIMRPA